MNVTCPAAVKEEETVNSGGRITRVPQRPITTAVGERIVREHCVWIPLHGKAYKGIVVMQVAATRYTSQTHTTMTSHGKKNKIKTYGRGDC